MDLVYARSAEINRRRTLLRGGAGALVVVLALAIGIPVALRGGTTFPGRPGRSPIAAPPTVEPATPTPEAPSACTCRVKGPPSGRDSPSPKPNERLVPRIQPPVGERIAFASDRDGNFDIYTMSAAGSAVKQVTFDPAHERDPAWSPDGKHIAFTRKKGLSDFTGDIYVMNADGSNQRRLVQGGAPKFSPDGKQVVYHALIGEGPGIPLALFVINLDGTGKRYVTGSGSDPTWAPDGKSIVYGGITGPIVNVWRIALTEGAEREHLYVDPIFACMPDVSPDGVQVAYVTVKTDGLDPGTLATKLVVAKLGGPSGKRVTTSPHWEFAPSWSPDGKLIAVERDTGPDLHYATFAGGGPPIGTSWIAIVRADGTGEIELPHGDYSDADPAFAPRSP